MQNTFTGIFRSFLASHLTAEVRELYASVAILDFAISAVMIFEPIYLYSLGYSLTQILYFWLAVYVVYFFLVPLGAKIAERKGFEHSIFYASIFLVLYYSCLFGVAQRPELIYWAVLALACQKMLYWPAYHANFATYSFDQEQGRQVSNLMAVDSLVYILGPLMGGVLIELAGFKVLFVVVCFLIIMSNIPMLITPEKFVPKKVPYWQSYKNLFKAENRRRVLSYLGYGEELIVVVIWPIFISIFFKDYFSIGSLAALSTLISTLLIFYVGRSTDKQDKHQVLRFSTIIYALVWTLRLIARTPLGVFLIDSLSRLSKQSLSIPLVSLTYQKARENGVMSSVLIYEMSIVFSKILAALLGIAVLQLWAGSFAGVFAVAGLFTLLYSLL